MPIGIYKRTDEHRKHHSESSASRRPEIALKISVALKGRKKSPEHIRKILESRKNFRHTDKSKNKIGEKTRNKTYEQIYGEERADVERLKRGYVRSIEHRKKMSLSHKGQPSKLRGIKLSDEHKKKLSLSRIHYMQNNPAKFSNTKPELIMKGLLDSLNVEYVHQKWIEHTALVDFYIPSKTLIIEVDGCYWHCCQHCGFENRSNKREKDTEKTQKLESLGYKVLRFWEHDLQHMKLIHLP